MQAAQSENTGREYPVAPRIGVGIVVFVNNKLVLVKRRQEPAKGLWTFPGGLLELGETAAEATKREAKEEIGLQIEIDSLLDIVEYIERDKNDRVKYHYLLLDYLAFAVGGKLRAGSDVEEVATVAIDDLSRWDLPDITRRFVEKHLIKLVAAGKIHEKRRE